MRYRFRTRRAYLEKLIADHEVDWVNSLFLSCRFRAHRIGPYNEFVYVFFKCLSEERLNYAEGWFAEQNAAEAAETTCWTAGKCSAVARTSRPTSRGSVGGRWRADLPDARVEVAPGRTASA